MNDKAAIATLTALLGKYPLTDEEAEAVRRAIGILGWSTLAESRLERMGKTRAERSSRQEKA
ncbi:MAG TPA: hypothetical protein VLB83_05490 [Candidatus Paceibacterota bacterium]|nr:hypothetical protein [Candidatus Paceibacterota bacterium]